MGILHGVLWEGSLGPGRKARPWTLGGLLQGMRQARLMRALHKGTAEAAKEGM